MGGVVAMETIFSFTSRTVVTVEPSANVIVVVLSSALELATLELETLELAALRLAATFAGALPEDAVLEDALLEDALLEDAVLAAILPGFSEPVPDFEAVSEMD